MSLLPKTSLQTIPADFIGQYGLGYTLAAVPSDGLREAIGEVLECLAGTLPAGSVWPMPPTTLHITLCEIIESKPYAQDKDVLFAMHRQLYEEGAARAFAGLAPFVVDFHCVEASSHAIIVRGEDNGMFNELRRRLLREFSLPRETKSPPPIIHSTIARYLVPLRLSKVQHAVGRQSFHFSECIQDFVLLKTIKRPLLEYETLRTYPLAATRSGHLP